MKSEAQVQSWRAIEALRAGVPNRDAVRALGSQQSDIEERFRNQLAAVKDGFAGGTTAEGMLIAGDFGTGKSHLLEYLQHIALEEHFVCSKVVISKETPLHDPAKLYSAAIESARVQEHTGFALHEIARKLDFNNKEYAEFYKWLNAPGSGLSSHFAATVFVFQHGKGSNYPEYSDRIIRFWSGSNIPVPELRKWLREMGETATYRIAKVSTRDLALQRCQFVPRLMVAAGYAGWVILIDEVELISAYSLQQRAKSYAEITRLVGKQEDERIPGLTTVLSITIDYVARVLDERNDEEKIPGRLRAVGGDREALLAAQAERGMRLIRQQPLRLTAPTEAIVKGVGDKLRDIYEQAYGWNPPALQSLDMTLRMRQHVKRLIHEWDLRRLYPDYQPQIQIKELKQDYSERPELEMPPEDDQSTGDTNP